MVYPYDLSVSDGSRNVSSSEGSASPDLQSVMRISPSLHTPASSESNLKDRNVLPISSSDADTHSVSHQVNTVFNNSSAIGPRNNKSPKPSPQENFSDMQAWSNALMTITSSEGRDMMLNPIYRDESISSVLNQNLNDPKTASSASSAFHYNPQNTPVWATTLSYSPFNRKTMLFSPNQIIFIKALKKNPATSSSEFKATLIDLNYGLKLNNPSLKTLKFKLLKKLKTLTDEEKTFLETQGITKDDIQQILEYSKLSYVFTSSDITFIKALIINPSPDELITNLGGSNYTEGKKRKLLVTKKTKVLTLLRACNEFDRKFLLSKNITSEQLDQLIKLPFKRRSSNSFTNNQIIFIKALKISTNTSSKEFLAALKQLNYTGKNKASTLRTQKINLLRKLKGLTDDKMDSLTIHGITEDDIKKLINTPKKLCSKAASTLPFSPEAITFIKALKTTPGNSLKKLKATLQDLNYGLSQNSNTLNNRQQWALKKLNKLTDNEKTFLEKQGITKDDIQLILTKFKKLESKAS